VQVETPSVAHFGTVTKVADLNHGLIRQPEKYSPDLLCFRNQDSSFHGRSPGLVDGCRRLENMCGKVVPE
jgi:hypothetical protein